MQHLATYRGGIRHMTPEIRRGDIRLVGTVKIVSSVAVIVALSVSVTVNGVLYPRRIILTNGKTCCTVCSSNSIDCIPAISQRDCRTG